jgi:energy-coupling factor transport system ATP-binding protein
VSRREIRLEELGEPLSHYAHAVRFGDLLFVSGCAPTDASGQLVGGDDVLAQTRQVLANLGTVLAAAGLDPADVARDVGYVPQNPGTLLFAETLRDELAFTLRHHGGRGLDPREVLDSLGLAHAADRHPRDLSGGERERAALAAVLVAAPRVLLLDEPTRGMDYLRKQALGDVLTRLTREGVAILMATHDVELVAGLATRVVLLGDREVVADGPPRAVLSGSLTFATQINKLYGDGFLTVEDVVGGSEGAE